MADLSAIQNALSALTATVQQLAAATLPPAPPPSPVPVFPTRPITSYTSARAQVLPLSSLGHPASNPLSTYQPMLGVAGLGINMNGHTNNPRMSNRGAAGSSRLTAPQISQANTGRQNAISAHFPPSTNLVARGKRRGPAIHPPTLNCGPPPSLLDTVSFINPLTGTCMIRVKFEVLPHSTLSNGDFILCRHLRTSELGFLQEHHLLHTFVLPETTSVVDLVRMGARAMQDGPGKFKFDTDNGARATRLLPHEILPLHLLSLVNKGNPRANGVSYLTARHPLTLNMTIVEFTKPVMRSKFGHPLLSVEDTNDGPHLIVRAAICRPGARFTSSDDVSWPRTHSCLSTHHYHLIDEATEGDFEDSDSTETVTSGGEPDGSDDDEEENVADVLMPMAALVPGPHELPTRRALSIRPEVPSQPLQEFGLPGKIWARPFVPVPGPYGAVWDAPNVLKAVYNIASNGNYVRQLEVQGTDLDSMVDSYKAILGDAVDAGDCTNVFSPVRNVRLVRADGNMLSVRPGPEREVLYHLSQTYFRHPERYFVPRADGRYAISTTISMSQRFLVSPARLRELKILGLVLVLMLLHGIPPDPISPALFQMAFHNTFDALTSDFIREWYPELHLLAENWVACLESRDQAQHDALGVDIVHTGSLGPQPPSHPEIKAVFWGITAPCRGGFNMSDLFRSFPGGTERLLSEKWSSYIHDYSSIASNLDIICPSAAVIAPLMGGLSFTVDPSEILHSFLKRSGLSCRVQFNKAKAAFHPIVPLAKIDSPSFRPQMLTWACTGCPSVELANTLSIGFSTFGCIEYHPETIQRETGMANGTIVFRSCVRSVRIPLPFLIGLHHTSYPALDDSGMPTPPLTLQDAIDDWLLTEILGSIRDFSIL
ncbi:hypothetical protein K438DRAFT_1968757 [Mycena galopus ATCC 62051]|nr:hypothetical protein K438DRAFT_1968757 [Mycena galopus ATCC 62051]